MVNVGSDSASLDWKAPLEDGGSKIAKFVVEKRDEDTDEWVKVATLKSFDTSYKVLGLEEGRGYFFRVYAENEAGPGESLETDTVVRPQKPAGKLDSSN